jgi:TRAP-type C4-dicarboxylate transport system permease small subunit
MHHEFVRLSFIGRIGRLLGVMNLLSGACVITMMLLICADVFMRSVFNSPMLVTFPLCQMLLGGVVFFALAYTQMKRGHVSINLLTSNVPPRTRAILLTIAWSICLGLMVLMTWQVTRLGWEAFLTRDHTSGVVELPLWPVKLGLMPLACGLLCARFMVDIAEELSSVFGSAPKPDAGKE